MPAAAWAARSGDPVLFVERDSVPKPTLDALRRLKGVPVYALGPPSAISDKALTQVDKVTATVKRIGADDPVQNAIDFARYVDGTFGWNINDPGHGFVIANDARPLDAAAAAALSASGDWGPLLLTDDPTQVPAPLRSYLLDVKPGYVSDPTRAVYNHVWLIGDQDAISVGFQAQVDDLAEVAQVRSGTGPSLGARTGPPEHEPPSHPSHDRVEEPQPVSEAERPDRLAHRDQTTVEDIRALAGPSTPHFALQIRNRIQRLIDGLDAGRPGAASRASGRSRGSTSSRATPATRAASGRARHPRTDARPAAMPSTQRTRARRS